MNERQSLRYANALAAIKMNADVGLLDLTPEGLEFLMTEKCWINTDRAEARRCLEAATYGALDYLGLPRLQVPAEFLAGTIALYVHPVNILTACTIMNGAEWSENVIQGVEKPVDANELFAFVIQVLAGTDVRCDAQLKRIKELVGAENG